MKKKPRVVWCVEDKDGKITMLCCPSEHLASHFGKPVEFKEVVVCRKKS